MADRAVAFAQQLGRTHQELRRQLQQLRTGSGPATPALGAHCLAFCAALTAHHQEEDGGLFAYLKEERPEMAGTVAKLVEDHGMIAWLLGRVAELAAEPDSEAIRRELDGLAAIMESHFVYEERVIAAAMS